jgi:hypothetical protein
MTSDREAEIVRLLREHETLAAGDGYASSDFQRALKWAVLIDSPKHSSQSAAEIAEVRAKIEADGLWEQDVEWRIFTVTSMAIKEVGRRGDEQYLVTVSCDRQVMSCQAPTIEQAYKFARLYTRLIVEGFRSVGPPWADI